MTKKLGLLVLAASAACVEPTETTHHVQWSIDPQIAACTEVRVRVWFEGAPEITQTLDCTDATSFVWSSDTPPLGVALQAVHIYERDCEGLETLWCTTTTEHEFVGAIETELDLASDVTVLTIPAN